jgi:hypothetical protein
LAHTCIIFFGGWGRGLKIVEMKGNVPAQGETHVIAKSKNTLKSFFKVFSRTDWQISNKLGSNQPWAKGIQICSNKGTGPLQRGDNNKNGRWVGHLKIFSRITWPEKLSRNVYESILGLRSVLSISLIRTHFPKLSNAIK